MFFIPIFILVFMCEMLYVNAERLIYLEVYPMNNFCYYSPTKYVFGKGEENNVGTYLTAYAPKNPECWAVYASL